MSNPDKIDPDGDGKAGGCTNIHIRIPGPLESLRLLKRRGREQLAEITAIFDGLDEKSRERILSNPKVVNLQAEIQAIREVAHNLWEQGWLSGCRPGDAVNLDDLLDQGD